MGQMFFFGRHSWYEYHCRLQALKSGGYRRLKTIDNSDKHARYRLKTSLEINLLSLVALVQSSLDMITGEKIIPV